LYRKTNTFAFNKNNPFLFAGKGYIIQQQICKPGSVLPLRAVSIINLALPLLTGLNNLPILTTPTSWDTGASSSTFKTYLVFQLLRFTVISGRPEKP
jgi:hypothetical protein